jgi:sulfur carrier protein
MRIELNGRPHELADGTTVADLIAAVTGSPSGRGSAAVVDGDVVPRSTWPACALRDGQIVELITAVQGG